ncbi:hypothetical protein [Kangiella shandongensis]|uniref:hypothetical protein n=1 Tax=Kangiella shandongensis TaxID=2763258 RepID=UPI001CBCECEB|nr:hypothetical protein [Kangiella shandongensis]
MRTGKQLQQKAPAHKPLIQELTITRIDVPVVTLQYPHNVMFCEAFLRQKDEFIQSCYHQQNNRLPQLLIKLDGISDVSSDLASYIQSKHHQALYSSVAYVLSQGNMAVLEQHHLEHLVANHLQNSPTSGSNFYPIGIFTSAGQALEWLTSRPGSHHLS